MNKQYYTLAKDQVVELVSILMTAKKYTAQNGKYICAHMCDAWAHRFQEFLNFTDKVEEIDEKNA